MIDLADQVKSLVTIQEVAEHYGFHPNRAGYICCPFHHEKTASLKLYSGQRGFHCFGCGAGGSVIDFVMKVFDIPFRQAILRINADFAFCCLGGPPPGGPAESETGTAGRETPGTGCRTLLLVGSAEILFSYQRRVGGWVYPSTLCRSNKKTAVFGIPAG